MKPTPGLRIVISFSFFLAACGQDDRENSEGTPAEPEEFRSSCWDSSCCPSGTNVIQGSSSGDRLSGTSAVDCLVGLAGNDLLTAASGGDTVFGGPGSDMLTGSSSADILYGHAGDDALYGGDGNDVLVPGPGVDTVDAGAGNDRIILATLCEVVSGETIDGGSGTDTLTTPWSLAALDAAGLDVSNIEIVDLVPQDFGDAECCDTNVCGEHGTCSEASGVVTCTCDIGYTGRKCAWDEDDIVDDFEGASDPRHGRSIPRVGFIFAMPRPTRWT